MVKEKNNQSIDDNTTGQQKKTLDDIKKKSPMNWGVLDFAESVHQNTRED
ncbi:MULTISPECIES: hypothetical protein [unclassified Bacillus (in: firmicutes)]|nr:MULTISPECIES: hypothetical protein [unclassified Bacillus (in: firmicutes)]